MFGRAEGACYARQIERGTIVCRRDGAGTVTPLELKWSFET